MSLAKHRAISLVAMSQAQLTLIAQAPGFWWEKTPAMMQLAITTNQAVTKIYRDARSPNRGAI